MNKLFIAVAFITTFFVHGFQFFKKQTPHVNALTKFLGFKEGAERERECSGSVTVPHCRALIINVGQQSGVCSADR